MKLIASKLLIIFLALYATLVCVGTLNAQECTAEDAAKAENESGYIRDWTSLYQSYQRYSHCDDGSIAEGYVESIVYLLVHKWDRINEVKQLIRKDKDFERFILRHIGEMVSEKDSKQIERHAKKQCPSGLASFCKKIEKALSD